MTLGRYYTDSDVFLVDSVDLADISEFFADIFTFHRDWFWSLNITIFRLRRAAAEAAVAIAMKGDDTQQKSPRYWAKSTLLSQK